MSLLDITRVLVPRECAEHTYSFLRAAGKNKLEAVALWAGVKKGNEFAVHYSITPKQKSYSLESGLMYRVDGEELYNINVWLHQNKLTLIAQIHSHPGEAYHSETDDAFPIVTKDGSVSIVVPDFASRPFAKEDWAVYRLIPKRGWSPLSANEIESFIKVELT